MAQSVPLRPAHSRWKCFAFRASRLQLPVLVLLSSLAILAWMKWVLEGDYGMFIDMFAFQLVFAPFARMHLGTAALAKRFEFLPLGASLQVASIPGIYTEQGGHELAMETNAVACGADIIFPSQEALSACTQYDSVSIRTFSTCGRPMPPADLAACAKSKDWGQQDLIMHIGKKALGYVFGRPHVTRWVNMTVDVTPSNCGDTSQSQRMLALAGGMPSMANRLAKRGDRSMREKLGVGVHVPPLVNEAETGIPMHLGYNWQMHVVGMTCARDLMAMLHASHWHTLPHRATSDVREVLVPFQDDAFRVEAKPAAKTMPWHQEAGVNARVTAHSPTYERLIQRLGHSLQLLCPAHIELFSHPSVETSIRAILYMTAWLGMDTPTVKRLTRNCSMEGLESRPHVRRMPLVWLQRIEYPLATLRPGEAEECQQVAATWQHFRSLTMTARGLYHTVLSDAVSWVRQHGAAATTADGDSDRSALRVMGAPAQDGLAVQDTWLRTTLLFSFIYRRTRKKGNLHNVHVQPVNTFKLTEQPTMAAAAQSDILVCVSNPSLEALIGLPPWGGVLELIGTEWFAEPSTAQAMAHRLDLAHMQVAPDTLKGFTDALLYVPGRDDLLDVPARPFAQAVFTAALEEMATEVRRRRRVWLQEHAATNS